MRGFWILDVFGSSQSVLMMKSKALYLQRCGDWIKSELVPVIWIRAVTHFNPLTEYETSTHKAPKLLLIELQKRPFILDSRFL
jgi:hypothetical protein